MIDFINQRGKPFRSRGKSLCKWRFTPWSRSDFTGTL